MPDFLTTKGLTELLPWLTEKAVRNLVARKKIPYRKPGGRLIFIWAEIKDWIDDSPGIKIKELNRETEE